MLLKSVATIDLLSDECDFSIITDVPAKLLNPSVTMAVWWTKQSPDPSFGAMNPNPLVTSKNFTLPVFEWSMF